MPRLLARVLLVFSVPFATAFGQAPAVGPGPDAAATENTKPFSLEDAVALALRKNFDLQVQAYNVENAKDAIVIQEAAFDPTVNASIRRNLSQAASNTSVLDGAQREGARNDNTSVSVGAALPRIPLTNGSVSVSTNLSKGATNSTNALVNPSYGNGVSATLNQPLLNGAGRPALEARPEHRYDQLQEPRAGGHRGHRGGILQSGRRPRDPAHSPAYLPIQSAAPR